MLTARGWWFLVIVAFLLLLGVTVVPSFTVVPALLGISLLAWFAFEWVVFAVRVNAGAARLTAARRVLQGGRDVPMVWAGRPFEVRVEVGHTGPARVPFAVVEDRVPLAADLVAGTSAVCADLVRGEPARVAYTLRGAAPGVLRFEGVRVRVGDPHGFFQHRVFLRDESEYLILPPLSDAGGRQRADKRFNTLPAPGVHRLRRPGSGSELLDLRDYLAGDPPKMIAWKASARRDRLITKEFESDVPVRCVLFLDTSDGVRIGPPGRTLLTRMAGVVSGVAQAAAGNRDLVGLTTFDESGATVLAPARTKPHLIGVLRRLAEACGLQPGTAGVPADHLTRLAYPLAQELYPELMTRRVNSMPLGRLWVPLLDRRYGWLVPTLMAAGPVLVYLAVAGPVPELQSLLLRWVQLVGEGAAGVTPKSGFWLLKLVWFVGLFVLLILPAISLGAAFWLLHGARGWFGERRARLTQRKQLAALFAVTDGTGPAGIEQLVHDDGVYAERVGRFLRERQMRVPVPLYDEAGRYRHRSAGKAEVLARALVGAVGRARDNELYVILADLAEAGPDLAPVVNAVRAARARHHQVLVIVPWPADVPPPADPGVPPPPAAPPPPTNGPAKGRSKRGGAAQGADLRTLVRAMLTEQYHEGFRALRRSLGRVGATTIRVNEGDPIEVVLDRLDRLRGMRSRR